MHKELKEAIERVMNEKYYRQIHLRGTEGYQKTLEAQRAFRQGAEESLKLLELAGKREWVRVEELEKFAEWFNLNQWVGGKGDYNKSLFVKQDFKAIVQLYLSKPNQP